MVGSELVREITASDPLNCATLFDTFGCVRLVEHLPKIVSSEMYFSPQNAFAVEGRTRQPNQGSLVGFILVSFEPAIPSQNAAVKKNAFLPIVSASERQKAVDWIIANNKFGEGSDIISDLLFFIDSGVGLYPSAAVRIGVGHGLTKTGKGYMLESRAGKFTAREMTAAETAIAGGTEITRLVVP